MEKNQKSFELTSTFEYLQCSDDIHTKEENEKILSEALDILIPLVDTDVK